MADKQTIDTSHDKRIREIVEEIRTCRSQMEELETGMEMLRNELRRLLEERGENWSDADGYARLVAEGERTLYDTAALDELIISDPLRYGWLKDYRTKSPVASRIQVK